ncbi:MAG: alpha/beta fold hydrolase [Burkholderiales bacterium]|nr:alpha/beta fold hydrolase [Burkholderiales bacterium]
MPRGIAIAIALALVFYLGLCALLFFFQRSLIYFPQPRSATAAATIALPIDRNQVLVTVRPHAGPDAVVYFGGNAEDVSSSLATLAAAFPSHALYLLHYRGYGGSAGTPSEAALYADALALFDKVRAEHGNVVAVGRSLGSGLAVRLASVKPVARLVLITPYDSIQELAAQQFPYFPVRWLLQDKFESWRYAPLVNAPTLLIAAEHDEVIPGASTRALQGRFRPGIAALTVVPGAGHNTISADASYVKLLGGVR